MKVVFTVLDALPARHVGERCTPVLTSLAREAGREPGRARGVMTAATYPNHATFATGAGPEAHGIGTNYVPHTGGFTPAWELGPAVPTVFDACRAAGRSSAAVVGDQCLIGVMGARAADAHWPPN
ncbi:MAG TPA: alkaline phosphatase family protein, partial [Acidimicrobiia bacterium]|nr:alkaline phosphatase family protein [Acidimicrobiia bacterium]